MSQARTVSAASRLPELIFPVLVLLVFADPLLFARNFAGRDLVPYHLPVEREIHDSYARGELPLWTPRISGGRPLLANPNLGALYPVRPILSVLPFPLAFRLYPVLHWIVAGLGMIRLLRAVGERGPAAWIGACSYVFSGVGMGEVFYTNIQPGMALLPWVVWAAVRPAPTPSSRILPAALLLAADLYAGDVFTVGIAIAAWALWLLSETERTSRRREAAFLAAAAALAGLLAAPQIVASALWAPWTHRAVGGLPLAVATTFSVPIWRLLELVVPYPFGASWSLDTADFWGRGVFRTFFPTLFCGVLPVLAIAGLPRLKRPGARFALVFAAGAAAACVLPSLLPSAWGAWRSPIPLRYPEKLAVGLVFGLSFGAGVAFEPLTAAGRRRRVELAAGALLAAAAGAAALFPSLAGSAATRAVGAAPALARSAGRELAPALAEAGLVWISAAVALDLWRKPGGGRAAASAALLLWTIPALLVTRRIAPAFRQETVLAPTPFARLAASRDPAFRLREVDASTYRMTPADERRSIEQRHPAGVESYRRGWQFYTPSLWGRGTVFNADPDVGDFSRTESLRRVAARFVELPASSAAALYSSCSLAHAIRYAGEEPLPGFTPAGGNALQSWDVNPSALPAVRVVERWVTAPGPVEALAAIPRLSGRQVVLETGRAGQGADSGSSISNLDDRPGRLRFDVQTAGPGGTWVFVLRGFWPYRSVTVDGAPVDVVPAQLAFSAVAVPPGSHVVEWTERLPGGAVSWIGPLVFLLAALGLVRAGKTRGAGARRTEAQVEPEAA